MLFLVFHAGDDRYAMDASQTVEILPLVHWEHLPKAPAGVAGVFNYHGTPVPLVDLTSLLTQRPSRSRMSTRIIVIKRRSVIQRGSGFIGLLAEQVTETARYLEEDFQQCGMGSESAGGPTRIGVQAARMIRRVDIDHLLPADVQREVSTP